MIGRFAFDFTKMFADDFSNYINSKMAAFWNKNAHSAHCLNGFVIKDF